MSSTDEILTAIKPRFYSMVIMDLDGGKQDWYDPDGEYVEFEQASDELAEAFVDHNVRRGVKCRNLEPGEPPCPTCKKLYGNSYHVWNLQTRVKRFDA